MVPELNSRCFYLNVSQSVVPAQNPVLHNPSALNGKALSSPGDCGRTGKMVLGGFSNKKELIRACI